MPHFKFLFKARIKVESLHNYDGFFICLPELWDRLRSGFPDFSYHVLFLLGPCSHPTHTSNLSATLKKTVKSWSTKMYFPALKCVNAAESRAA